MLAAAPRNLRPCNLNFQWWSLEIAPAVNHVRLDKDAAGMS